MAKAKAKRGGIPWKLVAVLLVFFAALALLQWIPAVRSAVESAVEWAQGIMESHPLAGAALFFLFSAASPMLAFISSALLVPPATEAWGRPVTFVLLWGGWMVGVSLVYALAMVIAGERLLEADAKVMMGVAAGLFALITAATLLLRHRRGAR